MMELTISFIIHTPLKQSNNNEIFQEVTQEVIAFMYFLIVRTEPCCDVCQNF